MFPRITIGGATFSLYLFFNMLSLGFGVLFIFLQYSRFASIHGPKSLRNRWRWSSKHPRLFMTLELLFVCLCIGLFGKALNAWFASWFTEGNANFFGNILGFVLALFLTSLVFSLSPHLVADCFAPALPLQLAFAKMGCFCAGCCHSFEMPSFFYNVGNERYEFPIQMVEALFAAAFFVVALFARRRKSLVGLSAPLIIFLYSFSRFFLEFFRADLPNVLGPFDAYQILSFAFSLLAIALWVFLIKTKNHFDMVFPLFEQDTEKKTLAVQEE